MRKEDCGSLRALPQPHAQVTDGAGSPRLVTDSPDAVSGELSANDGTAGDAQPPRTTRDVALYRQSLNSEYPAIAWQVVPDTLAQSALDVQTT